MALYGGIRKHTLSARLFYWIAIPARVRIAGMPELLMQLTYVSAGRWNRADDGNISNPIDLRQTSREESAR